MANPKLVARTGAVGCREIQLNVREKPCIDQVYGGSSSWVWR